MRQTRANGLFVCKRPTTIALFNTVFNNVRCVEIDKGDGLETVLELDVTCLPDRRIARSKRALRAALVSLTEEIGIDAITVNDLCERADLNRGTFYNHYKDKDDLLRAFEDEILCDLARFQDDLAGLGMMDLVKLRLRKKPLPFLVELFDYLREQGDFLHALLGPGGDPGFGPRLSDCVCSKLMWSILNEHYANEHDAFVDYYVSFYAAAYLGVITRWIETGMRETSEEMALIALRLFFIKPGEPIAM